MRRWLGFGGGDNAEEGGGTGESDDPLMRYTCDLWAGVWSRSMKGLLSWIWYYRSKLNPFGTLFLRLKLSVCYIPMSNLLGNQLGSSLSLAACLPLANA